MIIRKKIACFFIKLSYSIINNTLFLLSKLLFPKKLYRNDVKKIIIFRIGSLGDNIVILPVIKNIKKHFPNSKIDILTDTGLNKKTVSIRDIVDNDLINDIIFYRNYSYKDLIKKLRNEKYDLYIELPENLWSFTTLVKHMIFAKLIGVKYAIGWYKSVNKFLLKYQEECVKFTNETERFFNILSLYGLNLNKEIEFPFKFDEKIKNKIKDILKKKNLLNKEKNVAFVIGAKREANRWPIEKFAQVANYLINSGYNILIIGGQEDKELANKLISLVEKKEKIFDFTGILKPLESAYLFKWVKFTITNDTGPMHMSYAVGTPVLVLYCSWQYKGMWYPAGDNNFIISKQVQCSPCFKPTCNDNVCMKEISVEEVINIINNRFLK